MRFTIERIRTLVLAAGVLLLLALGIFLLIGRWRNRFNLREIPQRLGVNIQQEANGVTYTQSRSGHTLFKIHASKVVQLKKGNALLHDVQIELYGADGSRVDRIVGNEFEYDQKAGIATAAGPVEITITRPSVVPAVAPKGASQPQSKAPSTALTNAEQTAESGQIDVKTSGVVFDQKSGIAATTQHVTFELAQGTGSSTGATFDSQQGHVVLDRAVELSVHRGNDIVVIHAGHGEFERGDLTCQMLSATMDYRGGQASAGQAQILFRDDGSAVRLDASHGVVLNTATGSHITAPTGSLDFNEKNQPRHGHMEGGVTLASDRDGRKVQGSSPIADLAFSTEGVLQHMHLERGVDLHSDQTNIAQGAEGMRVRRDWHSPVADLDFRSVGNGKSELATAHGTGGVVITGQSQRGTGQVSPSRMSADQVTAQFGPSQQLSEVVGTGHARVEETTAAGAHQVTTGDRLDAHMEPESPKAGTGSRAAQASGSVAAAQIENAIVDGHVVLVDEPAEKPGQPAPATLRATGGHAVYEAAGQWLHLTVNPRVEDGGLQLTADRLDVSQATNDAFAHGNVKATWLSNVAGTSAGKKASGGLAGINAPALGGEGPAHVVAEEAQLHQATGEATFKGEARLWQQSNSVAAPVIVLDRARQTLVARTDRAAEPVRVVLLSAGGPGAARAGSQTTGIGSNVKKPSIIRLRAGDLKYSDAERKAVLHAGVLGSVTAETSGAVSTSDAMEIILLPPGNHAGKDGGSAQLDRLTATGHVVLTSQGRSGSGEQLIYSSETDDYRLTGTWASPPKLVDPQRGTVTGETLIFNTRDDSVSVEGNGRKTNTVTTAPR